MFIFLQMPYSGSSSNNQPSIRQPPNYWPAEFYISLSGAPIRRTFFTILFQASDWLYVQYDCQLRWPLLQCHFTCGIDILVRIFHRLRRMAFTFGTADTACSYWGITGTVHLLHPRECPPKWCFFFHKSFESDIYDISFWFLHVWRIGPSLPWRLYKSSATTAYAFRTCFLFFQVLSSVSPWNRFSFCCAHRPSVWDVRCL